jgi:DNA polymerase-3 subunit gamma/tau
MAPSASRGGYDTTARAPVAQPTPDSSPAQPQLRIGTYAELIALAGEKRDLQVKSALEADLRLVRMDDGRLEVALEPHASRSTINDLARKLEFWTGRRWTVIVSNEAGQPTLRAQAQAKKDQLTVGVHADPRVQAVMTRFPGTQVIDVRSLAPEPSDDAVADDGLEPDDNDDL